MKRVLNWTLFLLVAGCDAWPGTSTPLDRPLKEQKETTITCKLTPSPGQTNILVFGWPVPIDGIQGTYHYKLWLPEGYLADPQKRWPCLFITSSLGNASMGNMSAWLKSNGYIVVMLVEAQNGPWGPIIGNFLAAHDDAVQRVRIQEGRKFATGVSGGARASSVFVQIRPGFCGLILQGAGAAYDDSNGKYYVSDIEHNPALYVAMTMGDHDDNKAEIDAMRAALDASRFLALNFKGGHTEAPPQVFAGAIEWIEHQQKVQAAAKEPSHVRETK